MFFLSFCIQHDIHIHRVSGLGLCPWGHDTNATQSCNLEVSRLSGRIGPEQAVRAMEEAQDASDRHQIREASWWRRRLNCIWKTGRGDGKADEQGSIYKQPEAGRSLSRLTLLTQVPG